MCQSDVYIIEGEQQKLLLRDATWLEAVDGSIVVRNDLGVKKTVHARLKVADLVQHRIVLEPVGSS